MSIDNETYYEIEAQVNEARRALESDMADLQRRIGDLEQRINEMERRAS